MKKQLLLIGITLVLITIGLSGCNQVSNTPKSDGDKFIGTWTGSSSGTSGGSIVFLADGTLEMTGSTGTMVWEVKNGTLVITHPPSWDTDTTITEFQYTFTDNDRTVILKNINSDDTFVWTRQ